MQTATLRDSETRRVAPAPQWYPPLECENRPAIETAAAAHYLGRRPNTLRIWAYSCKGPLSPIRVHGRLLWPVPEIRRLLEVS